MGFGRHRTAENFETRLRHYTRSRDVGTWNPERDIDWDVPSKLPMDLREAAYSLAGAGTFTEEIGLLTCSRLLSVIDDLPVRYCLAIQMADEAKHSEVFTRYLHQAGMEPPSPSEGVVKMLRDLDDIEDPTALFIVHTLLEGFALDQFSFLQDAFAGDPLAQIYGFVRQDEARHVAMGLEYLRFALHQNTSGEVFETLKWCEANIFAIGNLDPELVNWMAEMTRKPAPEIRNTFETRHQNRLSILWKEVSANEKA